MSGLISADAAFTIIAILIIAVIVVGHLAHEKGKEEGQK